MAQPKEAKPARKPAEDPAPQEEFLKLARMGKDAWNAWRRDNPNEPADFSGVNFISQDNREICFAGYAFGYHTDFSKTTFGDVPEAYRVDLGKAV